MAKLSESIRKLREATGKPVTTTEEIDDYHDDVLLQLGDWIFPNAHPYFHHQVEPNSAVRWTKGEYEDLKNRTDRFVWLKEVGMPTAGDRRLSKIQKQYFDNLLARMLSLSILGIRSTFENVSHRSALGNLIRSNSIFGLQLMEIFLPLEPRSGVLTIKMLVS
jgi:exo-beta-1,3-glucanase (GH17 family)